MLGMTNFMTAGNTSISEPFLLLNAVVAVIPLMRAGCAAYGFSHQSAMALARAGSKVLEKNDDKSLVFREVSCEPREMMGDGRNSSLMQRNATLLWWLLVS